MEKWEMLLKIKMYKNIEDHKRYCKNYQEKNRDKIKIKKKKYYQKNKEKILEECKSKYQKNKKQFKEKNRLYAKNNKEKIIERNGEYYQKNKDTLNAKKRAKRMEDLDKSRSDRKKYYYQNKKNLLRLAKRYRENNKEKVKESLKKYYQKNRETIRKKQSTDSARKVARKSYHKNKEKHKERAREYAKANRKLINKRERERMKSNPEYKIARKMRQRLAMELKKRKLKKDRHTIDYLGCSIKKCKINIESQFKSEMTWKNHGEYWHIDHRIPLTHFDLTKETEREKAFHYTNLQPLEVYKNLSKHNRYSEPSLVQIFENKQPARRV